MALFWNFDQRVGYMTIPSTDERCDVFKINLYIGNAFMIGLWESTDDKYQLHCFFTDKEHAERCLADNIFPAGTTFHLWATGAKTLKLAQTLTKYRYSVIWHLDEEQANKALEVYSTVSGV